MDAPQFVIVVISATMNEEYSTLVGPMTAEGAADHMCLVNQLHMNQSPRQDAVSSIHPKS